METNYRNTMNDLGFKLENGLLKLVESLERKQETGDWIDHLIIKESNGAYGSATTPSLHRSTAPPLHHSTTPFVRHSATASA
jgi:hypothetical protein